MNVQNCATLLLLLSLAGCDKVLGIEARTLDAHLTCEGGSCVCTGGFADCDGDQKSGCEVDLMTAPDDCGACGHGCLGGACSGGMCQPIVLGETMSPFQMVLAGDYLYVGSCMKPVLQRFPTAGGAPEILIEDIQGPNYPCIWALAAEGDTLYYATENGVFTRPLGDAQAQPVQLDQVPATFLSAGNGYVYYTNRNSGYPYDLFRYSPQTGIQTGFIDSFEPLQGLYHGPDRIYWADGFYITGMRHGDDVTEELYTFGIGDMIGAKIPALLVDETVAFWATEQSVRRADFSTPDLPSTLIGTTGGVTFLMMAGDDLYWVDSERHEVVRKPKNSVDTRGTVLARDDGLTFASPLRADATALYWFSMPMSDNYPLGTIVKLAR